MILIVSVHNDFTTTYVMRWLRSMNKECIRINEDDTIFIEELNGNDILFKLNGTQYQFSEIDSVWYRRGNFNIQLSFDDKSNEPFLDQYNNDETDDIIHYIHTLFKSKCHINSFNDYRINKLEILRYCEREQIETAPFLITQSKKRLLDFYKEQDDTIISKSVKSTFLIRSEEGLFSSYTHKLTKEDIEELPESFVPTFFQRYIPKRYEIRLFYLDNQFYSMVIFSQKNAKTQVDFRHYDTTKPNRETPYNLPLDYKHKINSIMEHFKVNCASIDIILSTENTYHLLDINPIGQFGMTSKPCNYHLEKRVAEYL